MGVVHGYDGAYLVSMTIEQAERTEGIALVHALVHALENLGEYQGLVKTYFSSNKHDALLAEDYMMTVWSSGHLIPAPQPHLIRSKK